MSLTGGSQGRSTKPQHHTKMTSRQRNTSMMTATTHLSLPWSVQWAPRHTWFYRGLSCGTPLIQIPCPGSDTSQQGRETAAGRVRHEGYRHRSNGSVAPPHLQLHITREELQGGLMTKVPRRSQVGGGFHGALRGPQRHRINFLQ